MAYRSYEADATLRNSRRSRQLRNMS